MTDQIDARNGAIEVLAAFGRIDAHRVWLQQAQRGDPHAQDFRNQLQAMQPNVRAATMEFLTISQNGLSQHNSRSISDQQTRTRIFENFIDPALKACNNVRSGMIEFSSRGEDFDATQQHPLCSKFNCASGLKTFSDYLKGKGLSNIDPQRCNNGDCLSQFERFICRVSENTESSAEALKNEFLSSGKVCNLTLEQMASN
jgi:hypothetical protein